MIFSLFSGKRLYPLSPLGFHLTLFSPVTLFVVSSSMPFRPRTFLNRLRHFRSLPYRLRNLREDGAQDLQTLGEEVNEELVGKRRAGEGLFMGRFSLRDMEQSLERWGILTRFRELGYDPVVEDRSREFFRWCLKIFHRGDGTLLGELVVRFTTLRSHSLPELPSRAYHFLGVEWILLQHPRGSFSPQRLPLPGQRHPGIGRGRNVFMLIEELARALEVDGILAVPEYYHNAVLYMGTERFCFASPLKHREFLALTRDLHGLSLAQASWAVEAGLVSLKGKKGRYQWQGEELIGPLSTDLKEYFSSSRFCAEVTAGLDFLSFTFDRKRLLSFLRQKFPDLYSESNRVP